MLYIRSPELLCQITGSSYSLANISPFPPSPPHPQAALFSLVLETKEKELKR